MQYNKVFAHNNYPVGHTNRKFESEPVDVSNPVDKSHHCNLCDKIFHGKSNFLRHLKNMECTVLKNLVAGYYDNASIRITDSDDISDIDEERPTNASNNIVSRDDSISRTDGRFICPCCNAGFDIVRNPNRHNDSRCDKRKDADQESDLKTTVKNMQKQLEDVKMALDLVISKALVKHVPSTVASALLDLVISKALVKHVPSTVASGKVPSTATSGKG